MGVASESVCGVIEIGGVWTRLGSETRALRESDWPFQIRCLHLRPVAPLVHREVASCDTTREA